MSKWSREVDKDTAWLDRELRNVASKTFKRMGHDRAFQALKIVGEKLERARRERLWRCFYPANPMS